MQFITKRIYSTYIYFYKLQNMIIQKLIAMLIVTVQPVGFTVKNYDFDQFSCGQTLGAALTPNTNKVIMCQNIPEEEREEMLVHES